jgi:hypothetical protein
MHELHQFGGFESMTRKIIRTTRQRIVTDKGEPLETIREHEVVRATRGGDGLQVYEPSNTLAEFYYANPPAVPARNEIEAVRSWMSAEQGWARQQSAVLRDVDYRLTYLEEANRDWAARYSGEVAASWALFYALMLVLGSVLGVAAILIFLSLIR